MLKQTVLDVQKQFAKNLAKGEGNFFKNATTTKTHKQNSNISFNWCSLHKYHEKLEAFKTTLDSQRL